MFKVLNPVAKRPRSHFWKTPRSQDVREHQPRARRRERITDRERSREIREHV